MYIKKQSIGLIMIVLQPQRFQFYPHETDDDEKEEEEEEEGILQCYCNVMF